MDSSVDDIAAKPSMRRGASFDNALIDGSPTSAFARTELEGHHIQQAAQGSWQATPAIQMDAQFSFIEEPEDTRPLLPALFPGSECYGNAQFSSLIMGSSTWDSKLSYPPGVTDAIAGIPIAITGNASGLSGHGQVVAQGNSANSLVIPGPGHMPGGFVHASPGLRYPKARLDFAHPALEHLHLGQAHNNGDVSVGKTMMLPQPWVLPSGSCPMDPSSDGLPAHVMSFTSPNGLSSLPADPGFAERAAKFSAFGNVGISESSISGDGSKDRNKAKLNLMKPVRQFACTANLSAPSSPSGNMRFPTKEAGSAVPMEESCKGVDSLSSFLPAANVGREGDEAGQKQVCASVNESDESLGQEVSSSCGPASMQELPESNGRKRKAGPQKLKDVGCFATNNPKNMDPDDGGPKWLGGSENTFDKSVKQPQEQSNSGNSEESTPKSAKEASKPPEAPKSDFIHVRARRGQATDSHSLAERVRREKISERMKFLQDVVPGCSKVTGKAVMLDEIINYVQSLQRQVEFLSMKLAAVNPRVEFSIDNLFARERPVQPRVAAPASGFVMQNPNLFPLSHPHQQQHVQIQSLDQCPVREVQAFGSDPVLRRTLSTPPVMETYGGDLASQAAQAWEDELQSVVQMNFAQRQAALDLQGPFFQGQMKVEQ